ncbi:MAG TPA: exo-beta-N-acetylmuramidase NamZ domain-containing protein, partial [Chitinophagaceae bacterium]|nr:exo-beta-N-acetylmuramidase NamZ domain-containing protein [Chitinophagaceae bacterium]
MKSILFLACFCLSISICLSQQSQTSIPITIGIKPQTIIPGAERIDVYLPFLKGKKVGIFANHTSMVGNTHLVDTLRKLGVNIKVIFGPEHGFRGTASAGEKIGNYRDKTTGIPVVSLYGTKRKPSAEDIKDVDLLIFDIQDVGTRFYTYISSMQEFLETALENHKPLLLLDRPNPNGHYVDGPVLDLKFK